MNRANRVLLMLAGVFIGVLGAVCIQTAAAQGPAPSLAAPGTFVMMAPPQNEERGYANFAWALNTRTGALTAHRMVSVKSAKDDSDFDFGVVQLMTTADIRRAEAAGLIK